jgi:hypothetical protein
MRKSVTWEIRLRTFSPPGVTDWPMVLEWELLALGDHGGKHRGADRAARLRNMLPMPDTAAESTGLGALLEVLSRKSRDWLSTLPAALP